MFHAELISMSRGQSYDQIDILDSADFEKYSAPQPFGARTVAFFWREQLIIAHPWCVRIIHLDRQPRSGGPKCFAFNRIIIDNDVSYQNGIYIDSDYYVDMGIPNLFGNMGGLLDQVTFSCSQGIFISHDANVVSMIIHYPRGERGVTRAVHNQPDNEEQPRSAGKINRRAR